MTLKKMFLLTMSVMLGLTACGGQASKAEEPADDGLLQFSDPTDEMPRVTLHTTMGDIKLVLYPSEAPKAVENFVTHCKEGYYDGLIFHRIIKNFMLQGGDPKGTGTGGESIWGAPFEDEFTDRVHNFRGALSMANSGPNSNGSQFFIVQSNQTITAEQADQIMFQMEYNQMERQVYEAQMEGKSPASLNALVDSLNAQLRTMQTEGLSEEQRARYADAIAKYQEVGGTPWLDYKHTVFGHVIEGMDIVDAIAAVETNAQDKPLTPVVIESVTVEE